MQYFHLEIKEEYSKIDESWYQFKLVDGIGHEKRDSPFWISPFESIDFLPDFRCVVDDDHEIKDTYPVPPNVTPIANLNISNKFYAILKEYSLMKYEHCDISLKYGDIVTHYNFLHFLEDVENYDKSLVNFDKTVFRVKDVTAVLPEDKEIIYDDIKVSSWKEFIDLREGNLSNYDTMVLPRQLYFDPYIMKYDLFFIDYRNLTDIYDILISERLAERLKKENITGIKIVKPPYEIIYT